MKKIFILVFISLVFLCGCDYGNKLEVKDINKKELLEKMDDASSLLIDVRSELEFNEKHLPNAININVDDIISSNGLIVYKDNVIKEDAVIIVYCRSGTRSRKAADKLIELGYKNVYDFGSIDNWG